MHCLPMDQKLYIRAMARGNNAKSLKKRVDATRHWEYMPAHGSESRSGIP
ncbi:hypothetical protein [Oryzifoliimicrobium ureilyticus]